MTGRDRMVLIGVVVLAVLAGTWVLVVSPERKKASKLNAQVTEAQTALSTAEGQLASAHQAQAQYQAAYSSIVSLGKAVPAQEEVPSLIYQLELASNRKNVDFSSIVTAAGSGTGSAASESAAATAPTGFTQMPFTFVFSGGFFDLDHLFQQLASFTKQTPSGAIEVSGRLLTIQSVKLTPTSTSGETSSGRGGTELTGSITATAYVLPASEGLTGPAGSPAGSTTPASTTGAPSSPTAPAIARVNP